MSKYVIISDLHMSLRKQTMYDGLPETLYFPIVNLKLAMEKAKELSCPLIIAGDINDAKRLIPQQVITETLEILDYIGNQVETYLILGNHDYELVNDKVYTYLLNATNINIVLPGNPIVLNGELGLVSYSYNRQQIIDDIININPMDDSIKGIISHFGLQEGKLSGSEYRTGEFSLKRDFIGYDKWLVLGHYHTPQEITDKVLYVGSPYPINKAEYLDNKRFIVLDLANDSFESIPTIHPKWTTIDINNETNIDELVSNIIQSNYMQRYILNIPRKLNIAKDIVQYLKDKNVADFVVINVLDDSKSNNIQTNIKSIHEFKIQDVFDVIYDKVDIKIKEEKDIADKLLAKALELLN